MRWGWCQRVLGLKRKSFTIPSFYGPRAFVQARTGGSHAPALTPEGEGVVLRALVEPRRIAADRVIAKSQPGECQC